MSNSRENVQPVLPDASTCDSAGVHATAAAKPQAYAAIHGAWPAHEALVGNITKQRLAPKRDQKLKQIHTHVMH